MEVNGQLQDVCTTNYNQYTLEKPAEGSFTDAIEEPRNRLGI